MTNVIQITIKETKQGNAISSTARELGGLDNAASNSITSLGRLGTALGGVVKIAAGFSVAGIVGAGAALAAAATAGLSFNNSMEQAGARINAFTKDADLTAQILQDVKREASLTPFEFDQMANAVAGLLPAAKQADVGIMDLLKDAEILAASNPAEGLEGAAFALREAVSGDFTSVIERFNLPRSMINDLKAEGVPALEIVRTAMQNMGYDMDLVTALANTAEGRWSTFKDTLTNLAGVVTKPMFDAFSGGLGGVNDFLTQINPQMEAFATMLAGEVSGAIATVTTSISKIVGAFDRFGVKGATRSILGQLGFSQDQISTVTAIVGEITGAFDKISGAYERFGAKGAAVSILGMLGMDPETTGIIRTTIDGIIEKIGILQQVYSQFGAQGAGVSLLSMLGLSSDTIGLITTSIQAVVDGFNSLANWWTATWPIIQAAALTGWEILKGIFAGFVTVLGPTITQFQTTVGQFVTTLTEMIGGLGISWTDVWNALVTATGIVATVIGAAVLGIIGVVAGLANAVLSGITATIAMFQSLSDNVAGILGGLTTIFSGWVVVISSLLSGDFSMAWEGFKVVLQGALTFWTSIWGGMLEGVLGVVGIISSTVGGFISGIVGFFQGMYDQLVGHSIIPDMINDIVAWFRKLPQMALSALSNFASQIATPFEEAWEAIGEIFKIDRWIELGASIITGILEGIKTNQAEVLEMLKSLMADAIQAAKDSIGFGSPAKEFMPLGESMVQGMLVGAESQKFAKNFIDDLDMGGIARQLGGGGSGWKEMRRHIHGGIKANFQELMTSGLSPAQIITKIQETAAKFNFPPSFASEFAQANGLIEHLNKSATEFQKVMRLENMGRMVQIGGQLSALGQGFADMIQPMVDERGGIIKRLQDFIKSGSQELFKFDFAPHLVGVDHVMMDQIRAQEQLNLLLREQQEQEALITKQKEAQQKIGFLQQQIELIKMGKELGGNIFQGIQFGLDASVEDLLAATNAVTMAMINQINSDLQIASPSRVLFKMFKDNVGGAMAGGLLAAKPMMQSAIQPVLNPVMNAASAAGKVVTNHFNMNVHTQADQSSVIGDFRTMQLMAG